MILEPYFQEDLLDRKMLVEILSLMMTGSMHHQALPPGNGSTNRLYVFTLTGFHTVHVN